VLIGYMDRPTTIEMLAYVATIATIYLLASRAHPRPAAKPHLVAQSARPSGLTDRDAA